MATIDQVKVGLSDFILTTMAPRMDETRQFLAGFGTTLLSRKADNIMRSIAQKDWARMIGLFNENGELDIETAFEAMMEQFKRQSKFPIEIPYFGCFAFTAHDIQDLYNRIKNA